MRVCDAFGLSLKKFKLKWKSNFYVIFSVGIIFCLIFIINLLFFIFREKYIDLSSSGTNGKVVLNLFLDSEDDSSDIIKSDVQEFNGTILGKTAYYDNYTGIVLPKELVSALIYEDAIVSDNEIPMLVSTFTGEKILNAEFSNGIKNFDAYRNSIVGKTFTSGSGTVFSIVGLAPGNFHAPNFSFKNLDKHSENIFNPVLEMIPTSTGHTIIIDDGNLDAGKIVEYDQHTIFFNNLADAYSFLKNGHGNSDHTGFTDRSYHITHVAGPDVDILYVMDAYIPIKNIICLVLLFIAMIITIFNIIRIIDRDNKNILFYYSVGATTKDIFHIYLLYFLEQILLASIFAAIFSITFCVIVFLSGEAALSQLFTVSLSLL